MSGRWDPGPGVLALPSGRLIRGRGIGRPMPEGPEPDFGVYLLADAPPLMAWETRWVRWRDFGLPADRDDARQALEAAWRRCPAERVEIACLGGRGRTGTALACVAILDGVPARQAVRYVRERYSRHAVETMWQRRYVRGFDSSLPGPRGPLRIRSM